MIVTRAMTPSHPAARGVNAMGDGIELQIRTILAAQLGLEPSEIRPEANILDDLGADSLDVVEMVMSLEQAFDIEMPDQDVEAMRTIADLERFVASALAA
jgi:acyl carrier protein